MATADGEITRTVVQTYIPEYQRDEWDAHAEELDMNRSEFIRSMVQAGRRGFDEHVDDHREESGDAQQTSTDSPGNVETNQNDSPNKPGTQEGSLKEVVVEELQQSDCLSWDDILTEITDDIEARLDETLQQLQVENTVRYSGRHDGYVLNDGDQ